MDRSIGVTTRSPSRIVRYDVYYGVPFDFDPQISHRPRRRRKPPEPPMWQMLKEGGTAARKHAGRRMLARRGGLASAAQQRELGFPNLQQAWKGLADYWRRWHRERGLPTTQAEADLTGSVAARSTSGAAA